MEAVLTIRLRLNFGMRTLLLDQQIPGPFMACGMFNSRLKQTSH